MKPYFAIGIPTSNQRSTTPYKTVFGCQVSFLPTDFYHSHIKNLRSQVGVKIEESNGIGTINLKKKVQFDWKALKFTAYQDLDLTKASFLDSKVAVNGTWRDFTAFSQFKFRNISSFTGVTFGLVYRPFTHLSLFAWRQSMFEEEDSKGIIGFELDGYHGSKVAGGISESGNVLMQSLWKLKPWATLNCSVTARPLATEERYLDLGVGFTFNC